MRRLRISPLLLLVSITCILMGPATAQEDPNEVPERGVFFSTEEDFVPQGPEPRDGNPIISDGDLLNSAGYVYMRNSELLNVFDVGFDLGLDAADVINVKDRLVIFSTELDHPWGMFTAGDLMATNGAILPNAALLAASDIPHELDLGLDAVHLEGKREDVVRFLDKVNEEGREFFMENPGVLMERLEEFRVDIWFSTEGTAPSPEAPRFLDGDLLSAATGTIVLSNFAALPLAVPAGIPDRGVDFGMDAVSILSDPIEQIELLLYSTEINGLLPTFTDGDALLEGDGVVFHNISLIGAFQPKVRDLGLDALSIGLSSPPEQQCRFTKVGGVTISSTTWDFVNGYVDPALTGRKDHTFGRWVSICGELSGDVVEHRVLVRPEGGADSPILMPAGLITPLGWRVKNSGGVWQSVVIDGAGWMNTFVWKQLNWDGDLILVNWYSFFDHQITKDKKRIPDGKYVLSLECKYASGYTKICDVLPIQIDNTSPEVELSDEHECQEYGPSYTPVPAGGLKFKGEIWDEHFSNYRLAVNAYWLTETGFAEGYYYNGPLHPSPLYDTGTRNVYPLPSPPLAELGTLDVPTLMTLLDNGKGGRYTVLLYAYDRSLLGAFLPSMNHVSPANADPSDRDDRNYRWRITNFEFYP